MQHDHQQNGPVSPVQEAAMELAAHVAAVREEVRWAKCQGGGEATDADLAAAANHLSAAIDALCRVAGRELSWVPTLNSKLADAIIAAA